MIGTVIASCNADNNQIEQALINLVMNACQAMPESRQLVCSGLEKEGKICLSVHDNGTGIKPKHLENILNHCSPLSRKALDWV